jgi:hypothetical protein
MRAEASAEEYARAAVLIDHEDNAGRLSPNDYRALNALIIPGMVSNTSTYYRIFRTMTNNRKPVPNV